MSSPVIEMKNKDVWVSEVAVHAEYQN